MKRIINLRLLIAVIISIVISPLPIVTSAAPVEAVRYTIHPGDTYFLLSKRFDVGIKDIELMNRDLNPNNLLIGQKVTIPVSQGIFVHTINKGDTLLKIAKEYSSTIETIAATNNIKNLDLIYTGDILAIPKDKKIVWLTGEWRGFGYSGEVSQEDYDRAYALYNSVSEEKLDIMIKELNNTLPRAFDEDMNILNDITNPRGRLELGYGGLGSVYVSRISTRMGQYSWITVFEGELNTNKIGFTNGIPVNPGKFTKALYVYELKKEAGY